MHLSESNYLIMFEGALKGWYRTRDEAIQQADQWANDHPGTYLVCQVVLRKKSAMSVLSFYPQEMPYGC
jgi:hypothetical protein